jgi:DNA-binding protein HU-beta
MAKAELIEVIAKRAETTKVAANCMIDTLLEEITAQLKKGKSVTFVGFGTFKVASRKARTGRNPQTGAVIKIAAAKVPRFSAGVGLKKAVNKGK